MHNKRPPLFISILLFYLYLHGSRHTPEVVAVELYLIKPWKSNTLCLYTPVYIIQILAPTERLVSCIQTMFISQTYYSATVFTVGKKNHPLVTANQRWFRQPHDSCYSNENDPEQPGLQKRNQREKFLPFLSVQFVLYNLVLGARKWTLLEFLVCLYQCCVLTLQVVSRLSTYSLTMNFTEIKSYSFLILLRLFWYLHLYPMNIFTQKGR